MSMTVIGTKTLSAFQDVFRRYNAVVHKDIASLHRLDLLSTSKKYQPRSAIALSIHVIRTKKHQLTYNHTLSTSAGHFRGKDLGHGPVDPTLLHLCQVGLFVGEDLAKAAFENKLWAGGLDDGRLSLAWFYDLRHSCCKNVRRG